MARKTWNKKDNYEAGKNMVEPWMADIVKYYGEDATNMTEEDKVLFRNLKVGNVAPLIKLLKSPERQIPLHARLILIQMLSLSAHTDYHLRPARGAHLGTNEHTVFKKIQSEIKFNDKSDEIGRYIFEHGGNVRGHLLRALHYADEKYGTNDRTLREYWSRFKERNPDLPNKPDKWPL